MNRLQHVEHLIVAAPIRDILMDRCSHKQEWDKRVGGPRIDETVEKIRSVMGLLVCQMWPLLKQLKENQLRSFRFLI